MALADTCYMDTLTTRKQVLAQLLWQGRQQSALYEAGQRGVQDHAQQRLGHRHRAALERPLQIPDLKCGLPCRPPPRSAAESTLLSFCYACKLRQSHRDIWSETGKLCLLADLRTLTAFQYFAKPLTLSSAKGWHCSKECHMLE